MSVLIKGMKIPSDCDSCFIPGSFCPLWINTDVGSRHPDCPLVELPPHGDLIENSVIKKAINDACAECKEACIEFDGFFADCDQCIFHDVKKALVNAPTIIPASCENPAKSRDNHEIDKAEEGE